MLRYKLGLHPRPVEKMYVLSVEWIRGEGFLILSKGITNMILTWLIM